jgi:4-aminobutyrate aminotransferase-like enzyme/Ser/Thr protein kinase RdoA (MazF antagonist)
LKNIKNLIWRMKFSSELAHKIVIDNYHLDCSIKPLAGYVDFNFQLVDQNKTKYLLKICKPDVNEEEVDFQVKLLSFLNGKDLSFDIPSIINTDDGNSAFKYQIDSSTYIVRMHSWVDGRMLSDVNPRTAELFFSWGETCGLLSSNLQKFDHPAAHRFDKWDPSECLHSRKNLGYIESEEKRGLANYFWLLFEEEVIPVVGNLRKSVNYSDAHEHNLLVNGAKTNARINGVIDFGDAIYGPTICELAIACAYAGMYVNDPIDSMTKVVEGYHSKFPVTEKELSVLFLLICGRLLISVSSAALNFHIDPENEYHQISAQPAWSLLEKLRSIAPQLVHYSFRAACGLEAHPKNKLFQDWSNQSNVQPTNPINLNGRHVIPLDLSVGSLDLGNNSNFDTIPRFANQINKLLAEKNADVGIGGYGEIRPFYTTDAYKIEGNNGPQWRTMHLGTDFWAEEETEVLAFWEGEIISIQNNDNPCDYGPTLILKHLIDDELTFYTLYGHLSKKTLSHCRIGQKVEKGEMVAWVGNQLVNGGWPPHLHFQIMLDLLENEGDFPGVSYVSEAELWLSICPSVCDYPNHFKKPEEDKLNLLAKRENMLGRSLSISYQKPLHMVRGAGIYLYDTTGRRYMDTVNNVAHVGHEHPRVVRAAQKQMELLNTNTRYVHKNIVRYAEALLSKCPKEMEVVYFVNSGSEANELALRMAKVYSAQNDIIAIEAGYHGNTGACIDISSYKFDGKGGHGAPEHTSIVSMPDMYRGRCTDIDSAREHYIKEVEQAIEQIRAKGRNVAGFIAESILSCGGQIVLPPGYLKGCYKAIRNQGGLCISDEVQVGFGRVGTHFWGFELQDVVPDIITCGKPIGNGHPLAAVITTKKVADTFSNGMEFFNTFGGNPVSCAIGYEILSILEEEKLQQNAVEMGILLTNGLTRLKDEFDIIGDVRGVGLFLGFELVKNRDTLEPAAEQASYLVNRMREMGILMSTDGPLHNVIKIKPPMCIEASHVEEILFRLNAVFAEDFMKL